MQPFQTPSEARQILLTLIFEQAAREKVEFTDLERRLLASTEVDDSVSEAEWEQLNDNPYFDESLTDKAATLVKHLRRDMAKSEGRQAAKGFDRCLNLLATEDTYLSGVLVLSDQVNVRFVSDWHLIVMYTVIGAVVFVTGLVFLIENAPTIFLP